MPINFARLCVTPDAKRPSGFPYALRNTPSLSAAPSGVSCRGRCLPGLYYRPSPHTTSTPRALELACGPSECYTASPRFRLYCQACKDGCSNGWISKQRLCLLATQSQSHEDRQKSKRVAYLHHPAAIDPPACRQTSGTAYALPLRPLSLDPTDE